MKTRKRWVSSLIATALVGAFIGFGASSAEARATKQGWWIRVNTQKTEASTISFQVGTSRLDRQNWWTWKSGQFTEFDLPAALRNAPRLYIRGIAEPRRKHAWFCVFYRDHGVRHFKFDGDEDHNLKQDES